MGRIGTVVLGLFLALTTGVAVAEGELSPEEELLHRQRLERVFGPLYSEQVLADFERQPHRYDAKAQRLIRMLSPGNWSRTGALEDFYLPKNGRVMRVPTLLIPPDEVRIMHIPGHFDDALRSITLETPEGPRILFPIHPANLGDYATERARYGALEEGTIATPTSSSRSLFSLFGKDPEAGYITKLSINQIIAGSPRTIRKDKIVRGVVVSHALADAHQRTAGRLPSGKKWHYYPEVLGVLPPGRDDGAYILRRKPTTVDVSREELHPFLALISEGDDGILFDKYYERAAEKTPGLSRKEYLWSEFIKPLLELYAVLSVDHGLVPENHKQNVGYVYDRITGEITGITIKDLDGVQYDYFYRKHLGIERPVKLPGWVGGEMLKLVTADSAQGAQTYSYFYMVDMNILQLVKRTLEPGDLREILERSDRHYVDYLSRRFGGNAVRGISGVARFWERLHRSFTPEEFYASHKAARLHFVRARITNAVKAAEAAVLGGLVNPCSASLYKLLR